MAQIKQLSRLSFALNILQKAVQKVYDNVNKHPTIGTAVQIAVGKWQQPVSHYSTTNIQGFHSKRILANLFWNSLTHPN